MLLLDLMERRLLRTHGTAKDPILSRSGLPKEEKKLSSMVKEGRELDFFTRGFTNKREENET